MPYALAGCSLLDHTCSIVSSKDCTSGIFGVVSTSSFVIPIDLIVLRKSKACIILGFPDPYSSDKIVMRSPFNCSFGVMYTNDAKAFLCATTILYH